MSSCRAQIICLEEATTMSTDALPAVANWHAHVYFDASSRDLAWALRERIETIFDGKMLMGRFHEKPLGPHPMWTYQMTVERDHFAELMEWLALNHGTLDVFVHPNTGDGLRDHRDRAIWIGRSYELILSVFHD
jgi:aromatic ring-cleaving dioxygenase